MFSFFKQKTAYEMQMAGRRRAIWQAAAWSLMSWASLAMTTASRKRMATGMNNKSFQRVAPFCWKLQGAVADATAPKPWTDRSVNQTGPALSYLVFVLVVEAPPAAASLVAPHLSE